MLLPFALVPSSSRTEPFFLSLQEHLAGALQLWGKYGYSEGVAGHITVRDSVLPDHVRSRFSPFSALSSKLTFFRGPSFG